MLGQLGNPKNKTVHSPSRRYVAMMNKTNFDGYYFRAFYLPNNYDNNVDSAVTYYMGELDFEGCMEGCFPHEDLDALTTTIQ